MNIAFPDLPPLAQCMVGDCDGKAASVWDEIQTAAEAAYDRSSACSFTTFVAYEYSGTTQGFGGHRNVIFRNERAPAFPTSSFETGGTNPPALWAALDRTCLREVPGCDVLTIPHNMNVAGGRMFPDPETRAEAETRAFFEPVVEIAQIKGTSECRFDRLAGIGVDTEDELCAFEHHPEQKQANIPPGEFIVPIEEYPRKNMIRNVLKDGLAVEQRLGINPFAFGFIGSTDVHNGTPGDVVERDDQGFFGVSDDELAERLEGPEVYDSAGALAVIWAEENSRDSLFEALRRKEVYATSGTRPIVRFFGG